MNRARWGAFLVAGVGLAALTRAQDPAAMPPALPLPSPAPASPLAIGDYRGAGSCSATACHGSIRPSAAMLSPVLRNEHTTWLSDDAHARAYSVLFNQRSEGIARSLASSARPYKSAHLDERCLACHATPRPSAVLEQTHWMDADGVGCEACHGASGRWLGEHTTPGWRDLALERKAELGMANVTALPARARQCAGCHVGDHEAPGGIPVRDVNHDLIAAGHPRLNFELSAFLANMPTHWVEKGNNGEPPAGGDLRPTRAMAPDFSARAWALGELATAESALRLLESRAKKADQKTAPWPEFTESGCFSCHHDLRDQAWRRLPRPAGDDAMVGAPRWGSWLFAEIDGALAATVDPAVSRPFAEALKKVRALMNGSTAPDARAVATAAKDAAEAARRCVDAMAGKRLSANEVSRLIDRIDTWTGVNGWDEATQRYLALAALRQSWAELDPSRKADQDGLARKLEEIRPRLQFPAGLDSPGLFDPTRLRPGSSR